MQTYIIAEMACSHEGSAETAKHIIDSSGKAGANAIQFQIWKLEKMLVPHHSDYTKLSEIEIEPKDWQLLASHVRQFYPDMHIIACIYENGSVDLAEKINVDAYKIHSSDLSNPHLIKYVAQTQKRIDLSVGASSLDEIQTAIDWIRQTSQSDIWLMYGYQNFPTKTNEIHLSYMKKLHQLFELPIGYQDHTDAESDAAFWLPATARGMGISIIEKHITHDRSLKGIDHEAALNPDEFKKFVNMFRTIDESIGISIPKSFSKEELTYRKYSKKSLVAKHFLSQDTCLSENDLIPMRTNSLGLPPDQINRFVGKKLSRNIEAYERIFESDISK